MNWIELNSFLLFVFAVLSDPAKRIEYDLTGSYEIDKYSVQVWNFMTLIAVACEVVSSIVKWNLDKPDKLPRRNILGDLKEWYLHAMGLVLIIKHQDGKCQLSF